MSAYSTQHGGSHYSRFKIQPTEYIIENGLNFCEGNVVKYVSRHDDKGGAEDLKKAIHYLQMILESEYDIVSAVAYSDDEVEEEENLPNPHAIPNTAWTWTARNGEEYYCMEYKCECAFNDETISTIRDCPQFDYEVGICLITAAAMLFLYFFFTDMSAKAQEVPGEMPAVQLPMDPKLCGPEAGMDQGAASQNIMPIAEGSRTSCLELQFDTDNGDMFLVLRDSGIVCILEYFPGDGGGA